MSRSKGPHFVRGLTMALVMVVSASLHAPALAHAQLEAASPAVNARLAAPPTEIRLEFSAKVDPAASSVELTDSGGHDVPLGARRSGESQRVLVVRIGKPLRPGRYRVAWRAASFDGHVTEGAFGFTVAP